MATVYKRIRRKPVPEGAEIVESRGRRVAVWTSRSRKQRAPLVVVIEAERKPVPEGAEIVQRDDKKWFAVWASQGRKQRAPLAVVIEDKVYSVEWFDWQGKRRRTSGGPDKDAAEALGAKLEADEMQRRRGLIDPRQERMARHGQRSLAEHLADYEAHLKAASRSDKHIRSTVNFVREVAEAGGFLALGDISADAVNRYVGELRKKGRAARTIGARLTAIKSLTRWLTKHGKLPADPLASVQKPNPKRDRRRERRMLLPKEWEWLRTVTLAEGAERFGMTAAERVLLYATAIQTGLRSSELRSLTRGRLFSEADPPYITCKARSTKNAKDARQYVQPDLAAEIRQHIATKAPAAPVFTMPHEADVAEMLRADLADARQGWLKAVRHDPKERAWRQESDFLLPVNHEGEMLDFHALRHTCGAWVAMTGAHPKAVQAVMRHSTITLTMDTYGHLFPGQEAETVARLPDMLTDGPEALRATGTEDAAASLGQHLGQQLDGRRRQEMATSGEFEAGGTRTGAGHNSRDSKPFGEERQAVASDDPSTPGRNRTCNLRIRSPLLCPLSYGRKALHLQGY